MSKNELGTFLPGMPAGQTVSWFGSGIFFFLHGMPTEQTVSRFRSGIFCFSSS